MSLQALYRQIEQNGWVDVPQGWLQGRTVYGGVVAAMLMHKAISLINNPAQGLLNASVTFVGPVQQARAQLTAEILRQGKSVTTVEVRLWQDGAVQSILLASFGVARASEIQVSQEKIAPDYPQPELLQIAQHHPLAPECFKQMQMIWAEGQYPCTGSAQPDFGGWFRFDPALHENREMTSADLMAAFDMWPPGVLPMYKTMAPASSLTWNLTCIHPLQNMTHDWLKFQVYTDFAGQGYATESAHLWDAEGRLIALSRQTVAVFA